MAELLTAEDVDKRIAALQSLRARMIAPGTRVCIKCDTLYDAKYHGSSGCFCDYESDEYED